MLRLKGPGNPTPEKQEEDEQGPEPETDEDPGQPHPTSARPGPDEASLADRGDGTTNPPYP